MRIKPLDTWVIMWPDGSLDLAHCMCMTGLDESCSHVAAVQVIFILESATKARSEVSAKKSKFTFTDLVSQQPKNDPEENFLDIIPSPTKQEEDQFLGTEQMLAIIESRKYSTHFVSISASMFPAEKSNNEWQGESCLLYIGLWVQALCSAYDRIINISNMGDSALKSYGNLFCPPNRE